MSHYPVCRMTPEDARRALAIMDECTQKIAELLAIPGLDMIDRGLIARLTDDGLRLIDRLESRAAGQADGKNAFLKGELQ